MGSTNLPSRNPTGYLGIKETNPPQLYFIDRAPTSEDSRPYDAGDMWIDPVSDNAYLLIKKIGSIATWHNIGTAVSILGKLTGDTGGPINPDVSDNINLLGNPGGMQITGNPGTNTLNFTNLRNITNFVVSQTAGETEYTTIQSALDAANTAGSGIIFIKSGTYIENLTCYDKTELVGAVGQVGSGNVIIRGTHIPPASGTFAITKIQLESATDIFNDATAGTALISINECVLNVTNGYTLNLPNWTGTFRFDNCGAFGTDDGFINNTAGATIFTNNSQLGAGTANIYTANGIIRHDLTFIVCPTNLTGSGNNIGLLSVFGGPLTLGGSANWTFDNSSKFFDTITTSGSVSTDIYNSTIITGSNIAITHNSSNPISLSDVVIDSTAGPDIITGTGTIKFGSVTYLNGTSISGTIITNYTTALESGNGYFQNLSFDRGTNLIDIDGELIIGKTGDVPQINTLTAGSGITITNGPGSITISGTGGGMGWTEITTTSVSMTPDNGYVLNNAALVTATLPVTCPFGSKIKIVGKGAGGWKIAQNAGQTIKFGNQNTTTGIGGSLDSINDDDVVSLICTTADTDFTVVSAIGNITII